MHQILYLTLNVDDHASRPKNKRRWFIYNLQRRKICAVLYNDAVAILLRQNPLEYKCKKPLTWGGGHHCMTRISLQSGPMLDINCSFSHKPPALSPPALSPPSFPPTSPHMKHTFFKL